MKSKLIFLLWWRALKWSRLGDWLRHGERGCDIMVFKPTFHLPSTIFYD